MKTHFLFLLPSVILLASCTSLTETRTETPTPAWTETNYRQHILNREDSLTWDMEMFRGDIGSMNPDGDSQFPLSGVFPVPRYDIQMQGTFAGVGTSGGVRSIEGRTIVFSYQYTGRNVNNAPFVGERKNEVFSLILTLIDIDKSIEDYVMEGGFRQAIISRNNPDVVSQGFIKTKNSAVEYIAFLTADRNNYAIVGTRLFDLRLGRTVLIAPQKDGSFRSMQPLDTPVMSSDEVDAYVDSLIARPEVRSFFLAPGNIE